jgi:N-acetylglucosamine kinase-like BadF-type ATPase
MPYILGIDGGGTKTTAIISDHQGNILGKGVAGGSNYQTVGMDNAMLALEKAVDNAITDVGLLIQRFKAVCIGLAGAGRETDRALLMPEIINLIPADKIILEHDAAIALAGATACQPGIVVIAGTGSMAFGMNQLGEKKRAGGWGNILGDEGSAYYISRRALAAVCKAYDGRGPNTLLVDRLIEHLKLNTFTDIVKKIYNEIFSPQTIAAMAPLVTETAKSGDPVSIGILEDAAQELALMAKAVIKGLNMENEEFLVAVSGSVFNAGDIILSPFTESIKAKAPKSEIIKPKFEPAMGAILLALREIRENVNGNS